MGRHPTRIEVQKEQTVKRWLVILGGGALALTIVISGIGAPVFAQDDATTTVDVSAIDIRQQYLEAIAAELGVPVDDLESAITTANLQMVDLWAERARDRILQGQWLLPGLVGAGIRGAGDHDRDRLHVHDGANVAALAAFLGITEDEIRSSLQGGLTLIELAEANDKTYDELRTFLIDLATERIDARLQKTISAADDASGGTDDTTGSPVTSPADTTA